MGLNKDERAKISQFTDEIYDENKPPKVRLATAFELLELDAKLLGRVTARTERACRSLISKFKNYSAAVLRTQKEIRGETKRLSEALQAAVALRPTVGDVSDEDSPVAPVVPSPEAAPTVTSAEVAGLDLLPDPSNAEAWSLVGVIDLDNDYPKPTNVAELLSKIDIPMWTGEIETTNRTPVKLRQPSSLGLRFEDWELSYDATVDLECSYDPVERALYKAQFVDRIHTRLNELGIETAAGVFVPLEELAKQIAEASAKLQPPFVKFVKVAVNELGERVYKGPGVHTMIQLDLTASGRLRRFANLCLARIKYGFDLYGRKAAAAAAASR